MLEGTVVDPLSYGVEEEGPSANPREDEVIDFETSTVPLTREQEAELTRALTSTSEEYGIGSFWLYHCDCTVYITTPYKIKLIQCPCPDDIIIVLNTPTRGGRGGNEQTCMVNRYQD